VLGGETGSDTYPVVSAVQASRNGAGTTGIVTKLNAAGNGLVFSTYLGGNSVTEVFAIAADKAASTYVTGWSIFNSSFPTTAGAFQTTVSSPSGSDAFVVKYDSTGARVYATLLGAGSERADGIAVDGAGSAYVAGTINVAAIHGVTANVIGPGGGGDAMIAKFNPAGSALAYLTRIGGSSGEQAVALALDASNDAFFTGHSFSNDLPSAPAAPGNTNVALFGALDPSGTALTGPGLTWYGSAAAYNPSCPLGGAFGASIALDPNKPVAHIVGYGCPVSSFPVLDPVPGLSCSPTCNGDTNRLNSFLLRYAYTAPAAPAANGPQAVNGYLLTSSTPFAGASMTESLLSGGGIDNVGRVTLVGSTDGTPAATPNAIDASANGSNDGVVYRVRYETVPPFIKKEFSKATVNVGETVTLTFTIANKNPPESGISLTGISVSDALEDCMKVTTDLGPGFSFQTCGGSLTVTEYPSAITVKPALPGSALAAGQQCTFSVNVKATDPLSCPNATSRIQSDQGSGNLAEAVLDIEPAPQSIWSRAGGQGPGNTADAANWDGGISAPILGSKITFPPGTATGVNNNLPGDQSLNSVAITGNGFAIGGGTFNLTGGIENAATGRTLSAPI
jgi:uncharacterized repeat protein (TIGR01451 family)